MKKPFPLRDILTVTTGRLLTKPAGDRDNGIGALYELLNFMTKDNLFTHQLPRAGRECEPWIRRWHPQLDTVDEAELKAVVEARGDLEAWIAKQEAIYGATLELEPIPRDDHDVINPYDEAVQMRGTDEGITIVEVPEQ